MKRIIALAIALTLLMALPACGKNHDPLVGSWSGSMDLTQAMESVVCEVLGVDVVMEPVALSMTFTFTELGVFTCQIDRNSAEHAIEVMMDTLTEQVAVEGKTPDEVRAVLEENLDLEKITENLTASFVDCFYIYKDGCIYTGFDWEELSKDPKTNAVLVWTVELQENQMVITQIKDTTGLDFQSHTPGVLPMTFTKK